MTGRRCKKGHIYKEQKTNVLDFFNRRRGSIAHSLSLSPAHLPDMTEILLKGREIASHPSIHANVPAIQCWPPLLPCANDAFSKKIRDFKHLIIIYCYKTAVFVRPSQCERTQDTNACCKGWMDDLRFSHPFQQYFSHIKPMGGTNERKTVRNENFFHNTEKIAGSGGTQTWNR